jgi:hypothetical protein
VRGWMIGSQDVLAPIQGAGREGCGHTQGCEGSALLPWANTLCAFSAGVVLVTNDCVRSLQFSVIYALRFANTDSKLKIGHKRVQRLRARVRMQ